MSEKTELIWQYKLVILNQERVKNLHDLQSQLKVMTKKSCKLSI